MPERSTTHLRVHKTYAERIREIKAAVKKHDDRLLTDSDIVGFLLDNAPENTIEKLIERLDNATNETNPE